MKKIEPYLFFVLFFSFWVVFISLMWQSPIVLLIVLTISSATYLIVRKNRKELFVFLIAGIAGPIGEGLVASSGLWTYHGETLLGVPYWLPLAWGITVLAIYKLIFAVTK